MTNSNLSPEAFCISLSELSPEDRYERLKELKGNELFCEIARLRPSMIDEFMWHEKREYLESILVEPVSIKTLRTLIARGQEDLGPTSLADLVDRWLELDEFWRFEETPGDKGYALVRKGRVIDFSILEITCV